MLERKGDKMGKGGEGEGDKWRRGRKLSKGQDWR